MNGYGIVHFALFQNTGQVNRARCHCSCCSLASLRSGILRTSTNTNSKSLFFGATIAIFCPVQKEREHTFGRPEPLGVWCLHASIMQKLAMMILQRTLTKQQHKMFSRNLVTALSLLALMRDASAGECSGYPICVAMSEERCYEVQGCTYSYVFYGMCQGLASSCENFNNNKRQCELQGCTYSDISTGALVFLVLFLPLIVLVGLIYAGCYLCKRNKRRAQEEEQRKQRQRHLPEAAIIPSHQPPIIVPASSQPTVLESVTFEPNGDKKTETTVFNPDGSRTVTVTVESTGQAVENQPMAGDEESQQITI